MSLCECYYEEVNHLTAHLSTICTQNFLIKRPFSEIDTNLHILHVTEETSMDFYSFTAQNLIEHTTNLKQNNLTINAQAIKHKY
jgi:hypothetical protein